VRLEWDAGREAANRAKHGTGFGGIARFGRSSAREIADRRFEYGERRWRAIGGIDGSLHVLVYTVRACAIRVISLRKANPREATLYERG
jgi:uncharacterized DUF497 family protein